MESRSAAVDEELYSDIDDVQYEAGSAAWPLATLQMLPPGFRFQPTEEELVGFYLHRRAAGLKLPSHVIADVDLYKHDPWELPGLSPLSSSSSTHWFFFHFSDRKYPKGPRTNRATLSGYWKATGRDKSIPTLLLSAQPQALCGIKKTLVFYHGRAPRGTRTPWVMHEFHLSSSHPSSSLGTNNIVLCRIVKKNSNTPQASNFHPEEDASD